MCYNEEDSLEVTKMAAALMVNSGDVICFFEGLWLDECSSVITYI